MPEPSHKTPKRVAAMLKMHRGGSSAREIADELKLSHVTIIRWLRETGVEPNGGEGKRDGRERAKPAGAADVVADAQLKLAELAATPPPPDMRGVLERMRKDFGMVSALVEYHVEGARSGTSSMSELDKAITIQDRFATRLVELTPQEAPDPATDPTNLDAAAEVRRKIAAAVDAAERSAVCVHCGRSPFHLSNGKAGA
jgi:hypothetical protein